jgi:hypothetical protein
MNWIGVYYTSTTAAARANPFLNGRANQRVLETTFPYLNRRKKKGLRWPARPGLQSLSPCSSHRRLKNSRFAIQGRKGLPFRTMLMTYIGLESWSTSSKMPSHAAADDGYPACSSDYGPNTVQRKDGASEYSKR